MSCNASHAHLCWGTYQDVLLCAAKYYSAVHTDHILLLHSADGGHIGWCHFVAIVESAAVNICIQVFV